MEQSPAIVLKISIGFLLLFQEGVTRKTRTPLIGKLYQIIKQMFVNNKIFGTA